MGSGGGYGERLRRAALTDWSRGFADDVLRGVDSVVAIGVADIGLTSLHCAFRVWSYASSRTSNIATITVRTARGIVGAERA